MRATILFCLLLSVAACGRSSRKESSYRQLEREVNPLLVQMAPAAKAVLTARESDYDAIINACMSVDDQLSVLRDIKIAGWTEDTEPTDFRGRRLATVAADLLDDRTLSCGKSEVREEWLKKMCSDFCRESWGAMNRENERLRIEAKKLGVDIVQLSQ